MAKCLLYIFTVAQLKEYICGQKQTKYLLAMTFPTHRKAMDGERRKFKMEYFIMAEFLKNKNMKLG